MEGGVKMECLGVVMNIFETFVFLAICYLIIKM